MSDEKNTTPHDERYASLTNVQKMAVGKARSKAEKEGAPFDETAFITQLLAEPDPSGPSVQPEPTGPGTPNHAPEVAPAAPSSAPEVVPPAAPEPVHTPTGLPVSPVTTQNIVPPGTPPASETINLNTTRPVGGAPATVLSEQEKSLRQIAAEQSSIENRKWYANYPAIKGGICEFDGIHYKKSPFYKHYYDKLGKFVCLCGRSGDELALNQLTLLYVPHRAVFVCDSSGCEQLYFQRYGGFERRLSWHFFRREIPYYGSLLQDPTESAEHATRLG